MLACRMPSWAATRLPSGSPGPMKEPFAIRRRCRFVGPAADLAAARAALEGVGFVYHQLLDVDMFIDGPQGRPSEADHILFAGEKVRQEYENTSPELDESERAAEFQVTTLPRHWYA